MIRVHVEGIAGTRVSEHFLIDTGADRTVFSAYFHQQLGLPAITGTPATSLTGISGSTTSVAVSAVLEFIAVDGRTIRVSGNYAAFTDLAATDYSILGRNVLDIFDVIISRPRSEVRLLTPNHYYQILGH